MSNIIELKNSLKELYSNGLFSEKYNLLFSDTCATLSILSNKVDILEADLNKYKYLLCETLKVFIGKYIYWSHPDWKYETHVISDIVCDIETSDFFDKSTKKYKGTLCVMIKVDNNSGHFLADDIGRTLFFNKEEAIKHSKYPNESIDSNA